MEFDFGITEEQACILCHLCNDCPGCCIKCRAQGRSGTCIGQACSRPGIADDRNRWDKWMDIVATSQTGLAKYIPDIYKGELKRHKK